ncbi:16S rRNA (cytosine(967)-C(5))-methyltransferase [Prochlorococcus sp. MIT 1307]|uniref:16S rRNA (cytosine(967)-C(5))-methyltransferase n=1 Tax=Prochlorococcus sp. MIT 1307 TaxID=3096219 RepID=UPI002A75F8BE|nr:16S rRNA (cytosine(967)-C(5))-methyltransferase [Prochlorococcus sp. MIT 1307]
MLLETSKTGLLSRKAAWEVLMAVAAGAYADVAFDRVLSKYSLSEVDRRLAMEIAFGAIRQRYLLDCWLDFFGKVTSSKQPPKLRWLLHIGLYQLLVMERIPSSAALNTTVELAKASKLSRLAPVVNGVLRAAQRAKDDGKEIPLPEKPAAKLAQLHSFPLWLAADLIAWRGEVAAGEIAKASNQVPPFDLRVNRLRTTPEIMKQVFEDAGIESVFVDDCPDGLQVKLGFGDLRKWPGYEEGYWCVQDRAAQWVSPLLEPQPGETVLDACSAPGGKTTHLIELMGDKGEVWAVDRSKDRLKRLAANANRLGCNCLHLLAADSSSLLEINPRWSGFFQKILLDAPCSGLGTLARHPDARWRISRAQVDELVALQSKLLEGVLPLLGRGGRIVYSTCTIHPDENEHQIARFLKLHPELILKEEKQLWPDLINPGDGFYAAVIERVE